MSITEEADYVTGKNGVKYGDLVTLNQMQDLTDRLITKWAC